MATYNHKSLAETVRKEFPGLARCSGGNVILADGASGSQFHNTVIDGMVEQMSNGIANMIASSIANIIQPLRAFRRASVRALKI